MTTEPRIVMLGFLPWRDEARGVDVRENPAILAARRAAQLVGAGLVEVAVSDDGVLAAAREAESAGAEVVVACGQTRTEPRVERFGRVPSRLAPAVDGEQTPWLLAPDADELATLLNGQALAEANLEPMRASDDAGGYYCDHLCVELARLSRRRDVEARFVHVTAIDGCDEATRAARLEQYARQLAALARHLATRARARSV